MHYAPCPYCGRTTFLRVGSVDPDKFAEATPATPVQTASKKV